LQLTDKNETMRYTHYTLVGFIILLSAFTNNKTIQVAGFYNDISPNQQWVLYRVPDDWGADDLHIGRLKAIHIPTGQVTNIARIFIEQPSTFFLNDTMVAVPINGQVDLYNLVKNEFEQTPLITYLKEYELLQFSLSEDRSKIAVLLRDYDNYVDHIKENLRMARVELRIIDLKSNQEYKVEHYTYDSEASKYDIGDILWYGNQVIYSFQSKLYYYQLGNPKRICFTNRMKQYAIDGDELVYETAGYGKEQYEMDRYHYKIFSFKDLTVRDVAAEEEKNFCIISEYPGYPSYFFRREDEKFKDQDGLVLYQGKKAKIKTAENNLIITKLK
jgi:hypothetical protein